MGVAARVTLFGHTGGAPGGGSLGTLCPRLPPLPTAENSGLAGEELMAETKEVRVRGMA